MRAERGAAGALVVALSLAACAPPDASGPSALLLTLDATRVDALGSYAPATGRTPHLDAIAAASRRFTQAITVAPYTGPSHASMLTGLYPPQHGLRDFLVQRLPEEAVTLAEILSARGYQTAAFVSAYPLDPRYGLTQGFDVYSHPVHPRGAATSSPEGSDSRPRYVRPADQTVAEAVAWLRERDARRPFFLWVHLYEPHAPFRPPDAYRRPEIPGAPAVESRRRLYYDEATFMDAEIGNLVAALRELSLWDELVVAVAADHGEVLGEYGRPEQGHSPWLTEATLRVPLLLRVPGRLAPGVEDAQVSVVDVFPSLLDAVGLETPAGVAGRSLLADALADRTAYSETFYERYPKRANRGHELVSVRDGSWKLLLRPGRAELYDLAHDPGEERDVAAAHPERVAAMRAAWRELAREWPAERRSAVLSIEDEAEAEVHEDALRSLGYIE